MSRHLSRDRYHRPTSACAVNRRSYHDYGPDGWVLHGLAAIRAEADRVVALLDALVSCAAHQISRGREASPSLDVIDLAHHLAGLLRDAALQVGDIDAATQAAALDAVAERVDTAVFLMRVRND
jgi:hypothetical protein